MASGSFQSQVNQWIRMAENRMEATLHESAQDLVNEVQTPQAKGGRIPVDTSFLRNSLLGEIGGVPSGPGAPTVSSVLRPFNPGAVALVINRVQLGDRLVLGYTANYAPEMEARYAFVRSAAQNWIPIVNKAAQKVEGTVNQ